MRIKGIGAVCLGLALLSAVPAEALEERIILSAGGAGRRESAAALPAGLDRPPGRPASFGAWYAQGAVLRRGFRGAPEYALGQAAYSKAPDVDLLLHFDALDTSDEAGRWSVSAGPAYAVDGSRALLGSGAGSFRGPDSALSLLPGSGALLSRDSRFRDFSVEFWLFPANAENGEVILMWQSVRKAGAGVLPQQLSCVVAGGRVTWGFDNFFSPPEGFPAAGGIQNTRFELKARSPLVPRSWSHHLLRFDGDTGLLEYLVDGQPEATAYATSSGRETISGGRGPGGAATVFAPAVGAQAPLKLAADYSGLIDEFRVSSSFVEKPSLRPYGREGALLLSPVLDLGYGYSRLISVDAEFRAPGGTGVELSYRIAEEYAGFKPDSPSWQPLRPGQSLPSAARGRYAQIKVELYPEGTGRLSPSLSSLSIRYEPNPPPPPPARVMATPRNGALELRWSAVPEADIGGYLVYYGDAPGEYFGTGAAEGPSPIDAGPALSCILSNMPNGKLVYMAVAAYDAAAGTPTQRAGEFSAEISARPSRTAP